MNIDTQYAFTRAVAHHAFTKYAGVLTLDGELGDKRAYDPRAYGNIPVPFSVPQGPQIAL